MSGEAVSFADTDGQEDFAVASDAAMGAIYLLDDELEKTFEEEYDASWENWEEWLPAWAAEE
jgi:hypothetical protein